MGVPRPAPRLPIWVDGGFDGNPLRRWVMDRCRWIAQAGATPEQTPRNARAQETLLGGGADSGLASLVSAIEQRPELITTNLGDIHLSRHVSDYGEATGTKFGPPRQLFKQL